MARQDFIDQLQALGYAVKDHGENRIAFAYTVPVGKFANTEITLGFEVPADFPLTPPSGPHILPRLLPNNTSSSVHPAGGVHNSGFGSDWHYWSRPFPDWQTTDRSVRIYLAHIRHLFDTQ
jgi:hypothetical protein